MQRSNMSNFADRTDCSPEARLAIAVLADKDTTITPE